MINNSNDLVQYVPYVNIIDNQINYNSNINIFESNVNIELDSNLELEINFNPSLIDYSSFSKIQELINMFYYHKRELLTEIKKEDRHKIHLKTIL